MKRHIVTFHETSFTDVGLRSVLSGLVSEDQLRCATLLPRIGMALVDMAGAAARRLALDERILRVSATRSVRSRIDDRPTDRVERSVHPLLEKISHLERSRVVEAWEQSTKSAGHRGKGVQVALIDTGIAPHPQLAVAGGISFVSGEPHDSDGFDHGTRVAGILAAKYDPNHPDVAGVAPDVELFSVKILNKSNQAANHPSELIEGLYWSALHGMDIVSMSVGWTEDVPLEVDRALELVRTCGGLAVAAAGNGGRSQQVSVFSPARSAWAIAVGSVDRLGARRSDSSYGPPTSSPDEGVEIMAPGWPLPTTTSNGGYGTLPRTSAACPVVSGVAALVRSVDPSMTPLDVRSRLRTTAQDMPPAGRDTETGYGSIDAAKAVKDRKSVV